MRWYEIESDRKREERERRETERERHRERLGTMVGEGWGGGVRDS